MALPQEFAQLEGYRQSPDVRGGPQSTGMRVKWANTADSRVLEVVVQGEQAAPLEERRHRSSTRAGFLVIEVNTSQQRKEHNSISDES